MPPETRYARNGETNIAYQVIGRGGIDLVAGLGWVSHLDAFWEEPRFARFVDRLATFARVILYDKRGTGLSDQFPLDQPQTLDERVEDLRVVIEAVGVTRASLFDISAGGAVAALFAARYPELTDRLIIFAGFARRQSTDDYPWGRSAEIERALAQQPWGSLPHARTPPGTAADPAFDAWWASYLRRSAGPGTARILARLTARIDIRDELGQVAAPALILHRQGDQVVTIQNSRFLAEQIPNATLRELPGEGHLPFIGDQDSILSEIEAFLVGENRLAALDRTLATILAVEISGAAETAARLGDRRWSELRSTQRSLMRMVIVLHGGREITPTLDGSIVRFSHPNDALACARAVLARTREIGLQARAGIHVGELLVTGDDVAGVALYVAQRVMEQAGPDDLLVSGPAYDLTAADEHLHPAGTQIFPGLPGEWRLYGADRAGERPVGQRPAGRAPARVAAELSRREREIAELLALGLANRQIADELVISVATVERHVANILLKLGFHSRAQVATWAVGQGLLQSRAKSGSSS
jgi:pimeloyl-ACP methyl ester carboxylesterase/DNA-binding CsgD family transcriptional regulator